MAEGWTKHLKADKIEPYSAGIEAKGLDPYAVKVMGEKGTDISGQQSKTIDAVRYIDFDYIITLCDEAFESCPVFPGKGKIIHVGFDNPPRLAKDAKTNEEILNYYRRVCTEIKQFVEKLPQCLEDVK